MSALARLQGALAAEGGTLAQALRGVSLAPEADPGPAQLGAAGPRAREHAEEYELLLELIREGSLLHYGQSRVMAVADPDLALLLGDQLYALGLERLAALGDLEAVGELGRLISLLAQAHLRHDEALADALWQAGAVAVGWGPDSELRRAQELARTQDVAATQALLRAATERRAVKGGEGAAAGAER